jgi:hypothetical protein
MNDLVKVYFSNATWVVLVLPKYIINSLIEYEKWFKKKFVNLLKLHFDKYFKISSLGFILRPFHLSQLDTNYYLLW